MHRIRQLGQYVTNINFFEDNINDEHTIRNQILSTRIYIIVLITILLAFTLYTSFRTQTTIITISKPTYNQYEDLHSQYPNTLECPCQDISISYGKFINPKVEYHEICSSDFISQRWIDFLFYENVSYFYQLDFRHSAFLEFQILRTLCQQAKQTIDDSLIQFNLLQYITTQLVSNHTFIIQTGSFIETFKRTTPPLFQDLVNLFRHASINNRLFSAVETNYVFQFLRNTRLELKLVIANIIYNETLSKDYNFDCYNGSKTISRISKGIYTDTNRYKYAGSVWPRPILYNMSSQPTLTVSLPGIYAGCEPIESLVQTTTECFFHETCLNTIISYVNYSTTLNQSFTALNISQFTPETTIETLINELFLKDWIFDTSFVQYFNLCQPSYCEYTAEQNHNVLYIIVTIIGLYGGLTVVLGTFIPAIINFCRKNKSKPEIHTTDSSPKVTIRVRFYSIYQHGIQFVCNLNLFKSDSLDEHVQKNELISTRIYIILFTILLAAFTLYTWLTTQTKIITINNPIQVQFEQLNNDSVNNLQCPCSQISIQYDVFITFRPTYHQICSSAFVSNVWHENVYWSAYIAYFSDFREMAPFYFALLSRFCQLANETIVNSLTRFYATEYITTQALTANVFNSQIDSFIKLFQITTRQSFKQPLDMLRDMIYGNQLISVKKTNVNYSTYYDGLQQRVHPSIIGHNNCTCGTDSTCQKQLGFYIASDIEDYVTGMFSSCHIVDSLLVTTTECFYDEQCILRIKSYMTPSTDMYSILVPMDMSIPSHYASNTQINIIVENLFIEDWNVFYFYEKYYNKCRPSYCSYNVEQRPDFFYILSKVISIFGGLAVILKFLTRFIVDIFRKKKMQQVSATVSSSNRLRVSFSTIQEKLFNLNLFQNRSSNARTIRKQKITTRFYIIILLTTLFILVVYTSLNNVVVNKKVKLSSENQYEDLQSIYSTTLNCPCDEISIEYREFVEIQPAYHQICSSDFVNQRWINYLFNLTVMNDNTFRATAAAQFITLSSLCRLAQETVTASLTQFYAAKLSNVQLISSVLFEIQIESFIESFKISMPHTFKRTLDTIRGLIQGNAFMTAYESNWKFTVIDTNDWSPVYANPQIYNNSCSCATSSKCMESAIVTADYPLGVPELFIGCYPLESILHSSLECFYNQTCLNSVRHFIDENMSNVTFTILNSSLPSTKVYGIKETVQEMVDRLFVDHWYINKSYTKYFQKCQSAQCSYSYITRFNVIYIITTVMALYDGLSKSLKIFLPLCIHFVLWNFHRRQAQVMPSTESVHVVH
ncbi:hypothetical protein I4U23_012653 [Adineta vaga]|nr:hypothetical protein I4U23_012653 [Adineta vaga]